MNGDVNKYTIDNSPLYIDQEGHLSFKSTLLVNLTTEDRIQGDFRETT